MFRNLVFAACALACSYMIAKIASAGCPNQAPAFVLCDQAPTDGGQACGNRAKANCDGLFNSAYANLWGCDFNQGTQCAGSEYIAPCYRECTCYYGLRNGMAMCLQDDQSCGDEGSISVNAEYDCL
jgi:hypothetical protein